MAGHAALMVEMRMPVFFRDPWSLWQHVTNRNTKALLRQYFPQRTDLSVHEQTHLNRIANELSDRPRQTPGFRTQACLFHDFIAKTGPIFRPPPYPALRPPTSAIASGWIGRSCT